MARKHNPKNERIKREYLDYLREAKGRSRQAQDQAMAAIASFEASTRYKDFALFHIEQAKAFKRALQDARNPETGKPLATATMHARLMAVKAFFIWLVRRPGYGRLSYGDADYFNLSGGETRVAQTKRAISRPVASLSTIRQVINAMRSETDIEKRDRALIAFAIVSGARDNAIASLQLRHVDLIARTIAHEPRDGVRTKFSKTILTSFFPVGEDLVGIVAEWIGHLQGPLCFGPHDPLFPATEIGVDSEGGFAAKGLTRASWGSAEPIRRIFKQAFLAAGQPYHNPHSFRHTLARLRYDLHLTPEEWKAWSQNLGHDSDATTLNAYGEVPAHRQAAILADLRHGRASPKDAMSEDEIIRRAADILQRRVG